MNFIKKMVALLVLTSGLAFTSECYGYWALDCPGPSFTSCTLVWIGVCIDAPPVPSCYPSCN